MLSRLLRRITDTSPALLAALCVLAAVLITRALSPAKQGTDTASPRVLSAKEEKAKKEVIAELRRRLKKPAIVFRSKPDTTPPVGYVSCLGCVT